jgi:nucleotide sugar dehydrogenase
MSESVCETPADTTSSQPAGTTSSQEDVAEYIARHGLEAPASIGPLPHVQLTGDGSPVREVTAVRSWSVAVVGLGYVGLPTALGLHEAGVTILGLDISGDRLAAIRANAVDLLPDDHDRLRLALASDRFHLGTGSEPLDGTDPLRSADAVIITVPTPVDRHLVPELTALNTACRTVVERARPGQLILLTSTSYAGTTRDLLVEPLRERGLRIGHDIHVAFSPERIDPGVLHHTQRTTPRVIGGVTPACAERARQLLTLLTDTLHEVRSPEAAELTKLYENTFRAVTLALANEFAEICFSLDLAPIEITEAAATKPYGFLALYPGPGVGGHCIPADPHYLLWQLRRERRTAPVTEQAMTAIARRPGVVVDRAAEVLSDAGLGLRGAQVLVVGVSYKPGVQDLRESSALEIIAQLRERGAEVAYHDPLIPTLRLLDGTCLRHEPAPLCHRWDLALLHTLHPDIDYSWAASLPRVLDGTYRFTAAHHRALV